MGVTSGTMAGREDGYPEMKFRYFDSIESLAKSYGQHKDEKYYELTELDNVEVKEKVAKALKTETEKAKERKKQSIEDEIKKLQKQLKDLS